MSHTTNKNAAGSSLFIDGVWREASGDGFLSRDPVTQDVIWQGRQATLSDVNEAVSAAHKAFPLWSETAFSDRVILLKKFAEALSSQKQDLALIISQETGKPLWESLTEVASMVGKIPISIEAFEKRCAPTQKTAGTAQSVTRYKPHGVVAVLGPYNFPGHLPNGHIVPALLAGNTIVFKPSEFTPGVAELTVKIWQSVGLPNGALNLVPGGKETGQALVSHEKINGLFFTGSSQTGKVLNQALSERPDVMLALEMGGNNPLVVTHVKNKKAAALTTLQSAYLSAGQRCTCARRLIVPKNPDGDDFISELMNSLKTLRVGHYLENPEPFMGPVITVAAAENLLSAQKNLIKNGAEPLLKMQLLRPHTALLSPGLIDVTSLPERGDAEFFGPLLQLIRVGDFSQAIIEANRTHYGLSAGLLCDDRSLYDVFYRNVRAGLINWNNQLTGASSAAPFGGVGDSGNHRPSAYFAADYCSYPIASLESENLTIPTQLPPGILL
jgi:succinylglutamic semialdehyde dehydrogenase